jgi:hypothetical protein
VERRFTPPRKFAGAIRVTLALCLLTFLVYSNLPVSSASTTPACQLECCAGRPTHPAGSCDKGSCHAGVLEQSEHAVNVEEPLCGLASHRGPIDLVRLQTNSSESHPIQPKTDSRFASSSAVGQACDAECTNGPTSSTRQTFRHSVLSSHLQDHQPFSASHFIEAWQLRLKLDPLSQRHSPRGPPTPISLIV